MNLFTDSASALTTLVAMRAVGPVVPLGPNRWILLGYEECVTALRDHASFSSTVMGGGRGPDGPRGFGLTMLGADPPDHTRLRGLVSHAFTPRRIAMLEGRIVELANELLDAVPADGPFDLMTSFADPLPVTIIAELLGIPIADRDRFKRWSDAVVQVGGFGMTATGVESAPNAIAELTAYLRAALEERRTRPTDDLIGALMTAEEAGDRLTLDEALATCVLLLIAGNETTTNLIGNVIAALGDDRDTLAEIAAHPSLLPGAIEETLRYSPPVLAIVRLTTRPVSLGGQQIPAGALVFVGLAAANRDAAVFPDPERFDIRRSPNRQIDFGHGIHFCVGAPLARLEARLGLEVLLRRFPTLRRAESGPVERLKSFILNGPARLPVTAAAAV